MLITCWHFVKLHCRVHKEKSAWVTASCSRPECCSPPAEIFLMLLPINLSHATCTKHALWNYILENTWNRSRHFMSWVKNISKGRVGNFPLRAKYKLLFLPLGTDENRCWFIRRRMKVVPKKYFPLLLRNRTSPSHSDLRSDEVDVCQLPPSRRKPLQFSSQLWLWADSVKLPVTECQAGWVLNCCWDGFIPRQPAIPPWWGLKRSASSYKPR